MALFPLGSWCPFLDRKTAVPTQKQTPTWSLVLAGVRARHAEPPDPEAISALLRRRALGLTTCLLVVQASGSSAFWLGLEWGVPFRPLKVRLFAGDLRTA